MAFITELIGEGALGRANGHSLFEQQTKSSPFLKILPRPPQKRGMASVPSHFFSRLWAPPGHRTIRQRNDQVFDDLRFSSKAASSAPTAIAFTDILLRDNLWLQV